MTLEQDTRKILLGGTFCKVKDGLDQEHLLVLRPPSLQDLAFIDFLYDEAVQEARKRGAISHLELLLALRTQGIWSEANDAELDTLKSQVDELKVQLADAAVRQKRLIENRLAALEKRLREQNNLRAALFNNTAERYAEGVRVNALAYACAHFLDGTRVWPSWDVFEKEIDGVFIDGVIMGLNSIKEISLSRIRAIARSASWRIQWGAAKHIGDLFNKPIIDLTPEQHGLLYWSQVYDSVYESMDRPPEDVINNDEALDKWFEEQDAKRRREDAGKGKAVDGGVKLSQEVARHGEIFIVTNKKINKRAPDVQAVETLNTPMAVGFKKAELARQRKIGGMVNETTLRSRGDKIARQITGSRDRVISRNSLDGKGRSNKGQVFPGGTI